MQSYRIGSLGGDGIGPEVVAEGIKVLKVAAKRFGFGVEIVDYPFGADHYFATRELVPDKAMNEIRSLHAVLLGAIGDPRAERGLLEFGIVGRLRFDLDLYVNLRPIKVLSDRLMPLRNKTAKDMDILVVRENTEDAYRGTPRFDNKGTPDERASFETVYTRKGTERVIRYAFDQARRRPRKKLTLVDKANAVRAHDLYRRVFEEVGREYPDVQTDAAYVDAFCMWLIKNPETFDTVVTTNMFGDIVTDLGAALQGGLGIAAGGNIHPGRVSVFEPIHGSAPKHKGTGRASPMACILAVGMMLEFLGQPQAAARIEQVVAQIIDSGRLPGVGTDSGIPCRTQGDWVAADLAK
ncbi:MAG TPA: isocitrate/isopropylmalate family dehydrogenase [Planctomycetota bacterium]|nr:isocitrate/isopropylmalate family dehydrogenase [Planctomycetota bacterium]